MSKRTNTKSNNSKQMLTVIADYEFLYSFRNFYPKERLIKNHLAVEIMAKLFKEKLEMEFIDCEISMWRDNNNVDSNTKYGFHYNYVIDSPYDYNRMKKYKKQFLISMGNQEINDKITYLIKQQYGVEVKPLFEKLDNYGKMVNTLVYDKKNFIKEYGDMFQVIKLNK